MSTLTYSHPTYADATARAQAETPPRLSFWRRVYDAIIASRQRRADREISAFIASRGGSMTDEVEREIMRNLSGGNRMSRT